MLNSPRATATAEPPTSIAVSASAVPAARATSVLGRPTSAPCEISMSVSHASRPWRHRCAASGPAAEPVAASSSGPMPTANMRVLAVRVPSASVCVAKQFTPATPAISLSREKSGRKAATSSNVGSVT